MALDVLVGMTVFRDAVQAGSLAAAARRNAISAEMAGRHLRSLEARLGIRLLNRSTRQLSLTDPGRAYFGRCVAILDELALAEAEAGARQTTPTGHLRIAAPLAFATAALAPAIDAFLARFPSISLTLDMTEREVNLLAEGFDLALRLGDLADSGMVARRLASFPLLLVGAPAYLDRHGEIGDPQSLTRAEMLIYKQTAAPDRLVFSHADNRTERIDIAGRIHASDIGFLLELARRGSGLLVAPSFAIADDLRQGRLLPLLPEWSLRSLPLHVMMPHRSLTPAALRCFADFLADWFVHGQPIPSPGNSGQANP